MVVEGFNNVLHKLKLCLNHKLLRHAQGVVCLWQVLYECTKEPKCTNWSTQFDHGTRGHSGLLVCSFLTYGQVGVGYISGETLIKP